MKTDTYLIDEILNRSVFDLVDRQHLEQALMSGKKLRVKLGIDPTSPQVHLGRSIPLLKLKKFQELGHQVILIIGDFTGVIGDSSDKNAERPMLAQSVVDENASKYLSQFGKLLDLGKTEVRHNSEWLAKLNYKELCEQADVFSLNGFISRINIKKRLDEGSRVSLREVFYPMMQGYDSVAVKADVELGGSDQWFNLLAGRQIQKYYGQSMQDILTNPLIDGLDGRKMSSSWGNTINLTDSPDEMFGKVMSMRDNLTISYFEHCTEVPMNRVQAYAKQLEDPSVNPRDIKEILAFEITKLYHGEEDANSAKEGFINLFRKKEIPEEIASYSVKDADIVSVLVSCGLAKSRGDAKRLVQQSGIEVNGNVVDDINYILNSGDLIQKGKRFFARIQTDH